MSYSMGDMFFGTESLERKGLNCTMLALMNVVLVNIISILNSQNFALASACLNPPFSSSTLLGYSLKLNL